MDNETRLILDRALQLLAQLEANPGRDFQSSQTTESSETTEDSESTEESESSESSENKESKEGTEDSEGSEETENSEDTERSEDSENSEETESSEDTEQREGELQDLYAPLVRLGPAPPLDIPEFQDYLKRLNRLDDVIRKRFARS
ncbi:MAG: hypothetical protein ACN6PM_04035 [Achromobacter mucicolens]|uniref:hypothetical protein n=1 Tax=Achromobacter mucicolens TaxID=1389922 RepID=UPI003D0B80D8